MTKSGSGRGRMMGRDPRRCDLAEVASGDGLRGAGLLEPLATAGDLGAGPWGGREGPGAGARCYSNHVSQVLLLNV